jgi:eukaryotic-like serine/threonine-protein kinase
LIVLGARDSLAGELPKRIGRYDAFHQIGAGGMARIYLGSPDRAKGPEDLVVIKELHRGLGDDDHVRAMFFDEARIAMSLDHGNIVKTRDVVAASPDYYLVMEFLDGQSLLEVLRRIGRTEMPLDEHLWILDQMLAGLEYAHELRDTEGRPLKIVHRDVSPANVLVCYSGEVKLVDFGIAKAAGALAETAQGVLKGKLGYAAPEQVLGKPADPRSDLFAVGVMLWEAVAKERRSSGETIQSILHARIKDSERPLASVTPDAPRELIAIADRALAAAPEGRYSSAREFRRALGVFLAKRPRVGKEKIARLLRDHFAIDRAELRRIVTSYYGSAPPRSAPRSKIPVRRRPMPARVENGALLDDDTSPMPVDDELLTLSRRESAASISVPPPAPSSRAGRWLVPASAVAALVVLGGAFAIMRRPLVSVAPMDAISVSAPAAAGIAPAPSAVAPAPSGTPEGTVKAERVKVRVSANPRNAKLRPDARPLKGSTTPSVQSEPRPGSAANTIEPGMDLSARPASRTRSVDEKDPYAP